MNKDRHALTSDLSRLGPLIRQLREADGLTGREMAARAGLSPAHLSDIEHGRSLPSLRTLCALADVFEMGAADVLAEAGLSRVYDARALRETMSVRFAHRALQHAIRDLLGDKQE